MDEVSIVLSIIRKPGKEVEITLECEGEYNALALCSFSCQVFDWLKECKGKMIPWTKEMQDQKCCYAFQFETEEEKKKFLTKLFAS